MIKIVYFGTTDFSARVLEAIVSDSRFTVSAVITQPARPVGRDQTTTASSVKISAEQLNLKVLEPENLKKISPEILPQADLFVVFAYGLLIPQTILDLPKHGTLNIHPSLLPKYRGPTPVQTALMNGDTETGVTIMQLDAGMDSGPIVRQLNLPIEPADTTTTLTDRLIKSITPILLDTIPLWVEKKITATPQDNSSATTCKLLTRDDGRIDWTKSADEIYNLYRGLTPWPGIWTMWEGKRLKLLCVDKNTAKIISGVVQTQNDELLIGTGAGSINILQLQLEGKKPLDAKSFINGNKNFVGTVLAS